jgi:hypothetical protein
LTDSNTRPPIPQGPPSSLHAQRRAAGGPRQADSDQVTLRNESRCIVGWTLNVSRGGARLVVEEPVVVDQVWDLLKGSENPEVHSVRVVWVREEAGGQIVGVQYLDVVGTVPPLEGPSETT